jgi:hypothetical protein
MRGTRLVAYLAVAAALALLVQLGFSDAAKRAYWRVRIRTAADSERLELIERLSRSPADWAQPFLVDLLRIDAGALEATKFTLLTARAASPNFELAITFTNRGERDIYLAAPWFRCEPLVNGSPGVLTIPVPVGVWSQCLRVAPGKSIWDGGRFAPEPDHDVAVALFECRNDELAPGAFPKGSPPIFFGLAGDTTHAPRTLRLDGVERTPALLQVPPTTTPTK